MSPSYINRSNFFQTVPAAGNTHRGQQQTKSESESRRTHMFDELFKLMNNSVFGKTMEDARNLHNARLTIDPDYAIKWFSTPQFEGTNFIDGLYLIQTHKML